MKSLSVLVLLVSFSITAIAFADSARSGRNVDIKSSDGTILKGTYFAAAKSGPGALLFHQSNRTRESWDGIAQQLAAAGMNVLTVDSRGHGESGGKYDNKKTPEDVDAAFNYLVSQPGVNRDAIGAGGAGWLGVIGSVEAARRHPKEIKSLVLMSGETLRDGLQFLHQASQLPELFVFSDEDEYPPTQDAMKLLYVTASSPSKKLVHYSAAEDAPWLWYETSDAGRVSAHGGHGTDMFKVHPELPGIIVQWFVTTLIKTPGHAPSDSRRSGAGKAATSRSSKKRSAGAVVAGGCRGHHRRGLPARGRRQDRHRNLQAESAFLSRFRGCSLQPRRRLFERWTEGPGTSVRRKGIGHD